MTYKDQNYSFQLPDIQPGDIFINCNFSQKLANTVLTETEGVYFESCNLRNCTFPNIPAGNIINCLRVQKDIVDDPPEIINTQSEAEKLFAQVKPLAYSNPIAVRLAIENTFTPGELNGVLTAGGA